MGLIKDLVGLAAYGPMYYLFKEAGRENPPVYDETEDIRKQQEDDERALFEYVEQKKKLAKKEHPREYDINRGYLIMFRLDCNRENLNYEPAKDTPYTCCVYEGEFASMILQYINKQDEVVYKEIFFSGDKYYVDEDVAAFDGNFKEYIDKTDDLSPLRRMVIQYYIGYILFVETHPDDAVNAWMRKSTIDSILEKEGKGIVFDDKRRLFIDKNMNNRIVHFYEFLKGSDLQKDYSGDVSFDQNSNYSKDISTKSINNSNVATKPVQQSNNNLPSYLLVEEYMKQAQQGDREAQFNLAMRYRNGTNVPKDYAKAFSLMELSAKQNYESAQYWLSIFYKDGIGTEPNEALSIEWLKRAADNGNGSAKISLESRIRNYQSSTIVNNATVDSALSSNNNDSLGSVWDYITSIPHSRIVDTISDEYHRIKYLYNFDPYTGDYGCLEFAAALLLWNYLRNRVRGNIKTYAPMMIAVGDMFGCYFNGMSPGEWSDLMDNVIKNHTYVISYKEWCGIYQYLKSGYMNDIQKMPFNLGNRTMMQLQHYYSNFMELYNSTPSFNEMMDFYTGEGLGMKRDMPFRIDS